jgi:saccharopine dehydrogenase (NAD+, L-lysine-forming)
MGKVLIIGAGGVGNVIARKCAQHPDVFTEIMLASRTYDKCEQIKRQSPGPVQTAQVDADNVEDTVGLIKRFKPDVVINVALPEQDLPIMDACLEAGVDYIDTSAYEPDAANYQPFVYQYQWDYHKRFKARGITALLSCGFDPGVTNIFCAHAMKNIFDEIHTIDIVDCNGGDHGYPFATNFDPYTNILEISAPGRYFKDGQWIETDPLSTSRSYDFPEIGQREMYLMHHEELESLVKHFPDIKQLRFWMTFGEQYLTYLEVLQNVGMTRVDPVDYKGQRVVPLELLKELLPDPASLGARYTGKTCIGCVIDGVKDGKKMWYFVYNVSDHKQCYDEVGSQAISYTAGVPAVIGAMLLLDGTWRRPGVFNVEQLDPDPFMEKLNQHGLPWKEQMIAADMGTSLPL